MTRDEFFSALRVVAPITLATLLAGYALITGILVGIGFNDAGLHYTLTTIFPLIFTPAAVFPLAVMSQRLRRVKEDLEALVRVDTLTELPNRRAFFERAGAIFARGQAVTLMMVDIDHFKSVNDRFGHDIGDRVLHAVAQSLRHITEGAEDCGEKLAARIGGEEFAILVEGLEGDTAAALAGALVESLHDRPVSAGGHSIPVTVSAGVAQRRDGESVDTVLRAADKACYLAKRLGRNRWCAADSVAACPLPGAAAA